MLSITEADIRNSCKRGQQTISIMSHVKNLAAKFDGIHMIWYIDAD